ncbi:helix-turn-helix domain-containing protein [Streptomyces sp. NPDC090075]|uniref:AraC-like ligand-binding domain-containing protein n=1 Tax=Streptomyces sp. NPDC090075 TaxID=3365937 RepID=UPI003821DCA7
MIHSAAVDDPTAALFVPAQLQSRPRAGFPITTDAWVAALGSAFVPLVAAKRGEPGDLIEGSLRTKALGNVRLNAVCGGEQEVHRTRRAIKRADPGYLKVTVQVAGTTLLEQNGREAVLHPGDFVLHDTSVPYRLRTGRDFRALVVMFPRRLWTVPEGVTRERTAVTVSSRSGLGGIFSPFLSGLRSVFEEPDLAYGGDALGAAVLTSLAAVYDEADRHATEHELSTARDLVGRVHVYIEAHLGDPDLAPVSIASAHHISVRYLHRLFEEEGQSVASVIRRRRLERCRLDLADHRHDHKPVSAVAARWGLTNAAYFSRLFKEAYGQSPTDYRRALSEEPPRVVVHGFNTPVR